MFVEVHRRRFTTKDKTPGVERSMLAPPERIGKHYAVFRDLSESVSDEGDGYFVGTRAAQFLGLQLSRMVIGDAVDVSKS